MNEQEKLPDELPWVDTTLVKAQWPKGDKRGDADGIEWDSGRGLFQKKQHDADQLLYQSALARIKELEEGLEEEKDVAVCAVNDIEDLEKQLERANNVIEEWSNRCLVADHEKDLALAAKEAAEKERDRLKIWAGKYGETVEKLSRALTREDGLKYRIAELEKTSKNFHEEIEEYWSLDVQEAITYLKIPMAEYKRLKQKYFEPVQEEK